MKRLLFLKLGPYFMPEDLPNKEKYTRLSDFYEGEIIAVVNRKEFKRFNIGNFYLKGLFLPQRLRYMNLIRNFLYALFAFYAGFYSHYFKKKYDAIIAYDPITTGLLALIVGKLIGAKTIVEVNGNYEKSFKLNSGKFDIFEYLKNVYSRIMIPYVLRHTDGIKLVHENQLAPFKILNSSETIFIFPNFVPISYFKHGEGKSKYILFLGFPWFLKGVDILIKAFNKICKEFPEYSLKIVGYCSDKTEFTKMANGNVQIEFHDPVSYEDAVKLMSECSLFVLPSRTDSSPRVLREAMASQKPIIASNVDGIPTLIKHGYNGLLFESENVDDLAEKMKIIMSNETYARELAENGYKYVYSTLSEECYMNNFKNMVEKVINKQNS